MFNRLNARKSITQVTENTGISFRLPISTFSVLPVSKFNKQLTILFIQLLGFTFYSLVKVTPRSMEMTLNARNFRIHHGKNSRHFTMHYLTQLFGTTCSDHVK